MIVVHARSELALPSLERAAGGVDVIAPPAAAPLELLQGTADPSLRAEHAALAELAQDAQELGLYSELPADLPTVTADARRKHA